MRTNIGVRSGILLVVFWTVSVFGQNQITASEAKSHVGEKATVCGQVASARYASSSRGAPTFLNLDKPYPNQVFTVVIWGNDRAKFGHPEESYHDKRICVTGSISDYRGVPEIEVHELSQIKTQ